MHRLTQRMTAIVQPRLAVEADGVDDEGVAVPASDGLVKPRGSALGWMASTPTKGAGDVRTVLQGIAHGVNGHFSATVLGNPQLPFHRQIPFPRDRAPDFSEVSDRRPADES